MVWLPSPDQEHAHDAMLERLNEITDGGFLSAGSSLSQIQFGNLGEFVSFFVGSDSVDYLVDCHCDPCNAYNPLNTISRSGVDLMWVHFADLESDDHLYVQEVKTTQQVDLLLANGLIDDYQKLFQIDLRFTLKSRITALKSTIRFGWKMPELAKRCSNFVGADPAECGKVTILPTLVFDTGQASNEMAAIRLLHVETVLTGHGWSPSQIGLFGIGLTDLSASFTRLACGNK